jgi:hypothetical protein
MSSEHDRINATINRADNLLRERLRRETASLEREDAERAEAARLMALPRDRRALRRLVPLVRRLNTEPVDGEPPDTVAACLIGLRRKLPANHDLADVRADELPAGHL